MNGIFSKIYKFYTGYKFYFKSASLYLFASVFSAGIRVLINPLMARNLTYEDYAIIGYFNSFNILFLPMLNFSIISYYLRNYYLIPDEKRERVLNTIILSLLGIGIVTSVLVLAAFYTYFKLNNVKFPFWPFACINIFQIVFNNFLTLLQVNYRIKREAKKFANLSIYSTLFWLAISICLVIVFKLGAIGSMGASLLVSIIIGIYSIKKMLTKLEFDSAVFKEALKFSWPVALSAMLWYFISDVDRVFLEKLNDTKSFALYNIGLSLSGFLVMFYTAIAQTFEPDIYKSIAEKQMNKLTKIVMGIMVINAVPVVCFILFATPITNILTGGRYTAAADFARVLSLKNISTSLYYSVITVIVGFGYTKTELGLRAIGAIICVVMFKFLIAHYGFYGAAWGQVISFLIMAAIGAAFIYYKFRNSYVKK